MQPVQELLVLDLVIKVTKSYEGTLLSRLIKLNLDLRVDREFDLRDLRVLAGQRQMRLKHAQAFEDAVQATERALTLVTARSRHLCLVLIVLEKGHERKVHVGRCQLEEVRVLAEIAQVNDLDLVGQVLRLTSVRGCAFC